MRVTLADPGGAEVDVTKPYVSLRGFEPGNADLVTPVAAVRVRVAMKNATRPPKVPRLGLDLRIYDDDERLTFYGRIARMEHQADEPTTERWDIEAQSWAARALETATGSLTFTALTSDRDIAVGILRDALKNQYFGAASAAGPGGPNAPAGGVDDPVLAANEPDWPGVRSTAFLSGLDFSYAVTRDALERLQRRVPGVQWRLAPSLLFEWGYLRKRAPIVLHSSPDAAATYDYVRVVLEDRPVGYWRLGERSGTQARDGSGNERHGSYVGGVTLGTDGAVADGDAAARFDGADDRVSVADDAALEFGAALDFTLEAWALWTDAAAGATLVEKWDGTGPFPYALRVFGAGADQVLARRRDDVTPTPNEPTLTTTGLNLKDGRWHHLALVKSASTLTLYVDGVSRATATDTTTGATTNATALTFGARTGPATPFAGRLDEVALYAKALSSDRVKLHNDVGVARLVPFSGYRETRSLLSHVNKMRRGGAGASEATAYDEATYAKLRRIFDEGYKNDTSVPASLVRQYAYAELNTRRLRVHANVAIRRRGLEPGLMLPVVNENMQRPLPIAPMLELEELFGPQPYKVAGFRGWFLVQAVRLQRRPGGAMRYDVSLGDPRRDAATALAAIAAAAGTEVAV